MVCRAAKGWQVDSTTRFVPNVVSFLLLLGAKRWYVVGAYMPSNNVPDVNSVKQALQVVSKG